MIPFLLKRRFDYIGLTTIVIAARQPDIAHLIGVLAIGGALRLIVALIGGPENDPDWKSE